MAGFAVIPATRGRMGSWDYYVTTMPLAQVETTFKFAEELEELKNLPKQQRLQRDLVKERIRKERIDEYLIKQEDRFFGALLVAIYGGDLTFEPILDRLAPKDPERDRWLLKAVTGTDFGLLFLDGNEQFFVLDGQHRLAAIKEAIRQKNDLGQETISVIFIKHDPERPERSRRLFTNTNRYAKAPTAGEIYLMDEDDAVAIVARDLVFSHTLFTRGSGADSEPGGRVNTKNTSLPERSHWFTTMKAVYDMVEIFLRDDMVKDKVTKQFRPSSQVLDGYQRRITQVFDALSRIDAWKRMIGGEHPDTFRDKGHLLFKPVGQVALAIGVQLALKSGSDLDTIVGRLNKVNWDMTREPWVNVVYDPGNERMLTGKESRELAGRILGYMLGATVIDNVEVLREEYAKFQVKFPVEPSQETFGSDNGAYTAALNAYKKSLDDYPKELAKVKLPAPVA